MYALDVLIVIRHSHALTHTLQVPLLLTSLIIIGIGLVQLPQRPDAVLALACHGRVNLGLSVLSEAFMGKYV